MVSKKLLIVLAVFHSFGAMSAMDMGTPEGQQEALKDLSAINPSISLGAYQREMIYEQSNLSVEERAKRETNLIAEQIKKQVTIVYENVLQETGHAELAVTAVKAKIETDLAYVAADLRDDIREISLNALEACQRGELSQETSAPSVEAYMKQGSVDRSNYLNSGVLLINEINNFTDATKATKPNEIKKSDTKEYATKKELVDSLTSMQSSVMGGSVSSSASLNSSKSTSVGGSVSYRVRVNFLGADLNAGPTISFSRTYSTSVNVSGDGLRPMTTRDGNFDFYLRDTAGKIVVKNGKEQKRYMSFSCSADLSFGTVYNGSGGFSIAGVGADATVSRSYNNSVNLSSRRVALPEYIEGKSVTLNSLAQLCNNEFMNAKLMNNMTLKDSLNIMMKDVISTLVFSHPRTKCVQDKQCQGWFNKDIRPVAGRAAIPRCLEESREHYMACAAVGLQGTKCPLYEKGKLITDGVAEYRCDRGLRCKQVKEYGWFRNYQVFQYAEGRCGL